MKPISLDQQEQEELYVVLKPRESALPQVLSRLLRRIETGLFERLTIEEMEKLASRFSAER